MKKIGEFICSNKKFILILTLILVILSFVGMKMTKINYDILVYLPEDIDTVKGQNILADDFDLGAFSITLIDNMSKADILKLEDKIRNVDGVVKVISAYDVVGDTIPLDMLPSDVVSRFNNGKTDIMLITYDETTSSQKTLDAVNAVKEITQNSCKVGGMSSMVLDTMELSETEIIIYIVIAVILCIVILELSLDSYIIPLLLLINIGISILFNMGSNIIFGNISYITKALVAVLQLGVTTDFSIFLYHSYEKNRDKYASKEEAMVNAISETFTSVMGSSLTTIAGFLVLCTMKLTLGSDLGLVMAKGVLLGVICVLTVFPVLLLTFDKYIDKTKHKKILPNFSYLNNFVIKFYKVIFGIFIVLFIPVYLANNKIDIYYKLDDTLPKYLDSIVANEELKDKFNIVSPEIILIDKDIKANDINDMVNEIETIDGVDFVISFSKLASMGITPDMLSEDIVNFFESDKYQMILLNSTYEIASLELNSQVEVIEDIVKKYDDEALVAGEGPLMKDLVKISDTDFNSVNTSSIICIFMIMFFVLRSISLPILLIGVIEFAIFVNMSIPYFSGISLPFVAPIVLGTIQLGATIDYAILMTTTYLKNRKIYEDKKMAMKVTMDNCCNSIIVSGLCFFGATFGVGIYSKLEMISSLCTLISRGAIISMMVVIMVLPSIVLIFDKVICKTTLSFGKGDDMKNFKKTAILVLIMGICMINTQVYATSKDETVYGKLNSDGSVNNIKVVDHLVNEMDLDKIEDVSDLENIINVNGNQEFEVTNDKLYWDALGRDIYYQGVSNKDIPISVKVKYYLDGKESKLEDIIGKSGKVDIKISYTNNSKKYVNINGKDELLYTPFVVTSATVIDSKNNSDVSVTNGKVINNGTKNVVVGISTPGMYDNLDLDFLKDMNENIISYDTDKFELSSLYFVITPKIIDSDDLKIFDEMDSLYSDINTLKNSIDEIESGANSIVDGMSKISDGSSQIADNLNLVASKLEELENGTISLKNGLREIINGLSQSKELLNNDNSSGINKIKYLISQNTQAIDKLSKTNNTLKNFYDSYNLVSLSNSQIMSFNKDVYSNFGMSLTDEEVMDMNIKLINVKSTYESSYEANNNLITLLSGDNQALESSLATMEEVSNQISSLINTLYGYLTKVENGANELSNGTSQIKDGVKLLAEKTSELSSGSKSLYDGTLKLSKGINTFNESGITKLNNYVNGDVKSMQGKIEALVKLGEEYDTFTMKEDNVNGNVKMILVMDSVKVKEDKKEIINTDKKESFWTKFKNLFK